MFCLSLLADGLNVLAIHAGKIHQFTSEIHPVVLLTSHCSLWEPLELVSLCFSSLPTY